jgi:hypothetical protein
MSETAAPETALPRVEATQAIPASLPPHRPNEPFPGEIHTRMLAVMAAIGTVGKDRMNTFHRYAFRGIDDMYNAVQPAMVAHGIYCTPRLVDKMIARVQTQENKPAVHAILTVDHHFFAPDGSTVVTRTVGEAIDTGDKACNKAMSAAYKYALMETYCIPTEGDNDAENHSHELGKGQPPAAAKSAPAAAAPAKAAPRADLAALGALIKDLPNAPALKVAWCAHFKVATMNDLTTEQVTAITSRVKAMLAKAITEKAAAAQAAQREPGQEG